MSNRIKTILPPHLPMDAYVDFVDEAFRAQNPKHVRRQKELEERIEKAFRLDVEPTVLLTAAP